MRTEQEMMELVLGVAEQDERIRAVAMNGSRTNPTAPKDPFQDFDIVYLVSEIDSFIQDEGWVDVFGERIMMQTPEKMSMFPPHLEGRFPYLMLFADGNRLDLILVPMKAKEAYCQEDSLTLILLDKDHVLPQLAPPSDEKYWVRRPSAEFFADCCNEFWWVSTYVAKGLWRRELLYAQEHLNHQVRSMLLKMLEWQVGIQTDFSVSVGKSGKYLEKFLSEQSWNDLLSTYASGNYDDVWQSLFASCDLFRKTAQNVADHLGFVYRLEDDQRVTAYLKHIAVLPSDVTEIY